MTDINDLDRHIGRYVDFSQGDDGAAGFLVDIDDLVEYDPKPTRWITFDWGQGWPVTEDTEMSFPDPPKGGEKPSMVNPVRAVHLAMHDGGECRNAETCDYEGLAIRAVRGFRNWRIRQCDAYWENKYVRRVYGYAEDGNTHEMGEVIREAERREAPPHMIERMEAIAEKCLEGQSPSSYGDPDCFPFSSAES